MELFEHVEIKKSICYFSFSALWLIEVLAYSKLNISEKSYEIDIYSNILMKNIITLLKLIRLCLKLSTSLLLCLFSKAKAKQSYQLLVAIWYSYTYNGDTPIFLPQQREIFFPNKHF